MAACVPSRPYTAETPAFDRSWADIVPSGAVVRAADVATRPSASSSSLVASGLDDRTSWFSAKTAVWDPRILLKAIQGPELEFTLRKAVEWGIKCNTDLSDEEKVDNVLRFLAHAVGLQTAISSDPSSLQSSLSLQTCHSRGDSAWSNLSVTSLSASPHSDSASLLEYRCDTPMVPLGPSPTPSIRSYCMADEEETSSTSDLRLSAASSIPDFASLSNSLCYSETAERDQAMDELREIVRNTIAIIEADDSAPLGFAQLHAAAREISRERRSREISGSPLGLSHVKSGSPPRLEAPQKPILSLDTSLVDSATYTPLVGPTTFRTSSPHPPTPRSKPNKLSKPRPPSPNDPIPLQTFRAVSSSSSDEGSAASPISPTPLSLDNCRSRTPRPSGSPTWSHSLLKNTFSLLDVHALADAITGLASRKPVSPPKPEPMPLPVPEPVVRRTSPVIPELNLTSPDLSLPDSPLDVDFGPRPQSPKRSNSGTSDWQYLRNQSGDTDDTPMLATPIDEWFLPQFTPVVEHDEMKEAVVKV